LLQVTPWRLSIHLHNSFQIPACSFEPIADDLGKVLATEDLGTTTEPLHPATRTSCSDPPDHFYLLFVIAMSPPLAIHATSVELRYGKELVLRDVNCQIPSGSFVSILGPSGCGKTSLLRLAAGLQHPTNGQLSVLSESSTKHPQVGFVFQDPTLLPWRNVVDNIRLPLELSGVTKQASALDVDRVITMVGLHDEDREKFPHMLSGGMQMRVSLARALLKQPELILFDEPFAALDDLLRQRLNEEILRLWQDEKWSAWFVTHNVNEAAFLSQRVLVMTDRPGTVHADIEVPFSYPRHPELRATPEFAEFTGQLHTSLQEAAA